MVQTVVDEVDIMIHNGTTWVGYQDPNQVPTLRQVMQIKQIPKVPILKSIEPTYNPDGTALKNGDLWISTADLEKLSKILQIQR